MTGSAAAGRPSGQTDAVSQARAWLTEHGVAVPDQVRRGPSVDPERSSPTPNSGTPSATSGSAPGPVSDSASRTRQKSSRGKRREAQGLNYGQRSARSSTTGPDVDPGAGPEADPESLARTIALRQLTIRARSRHELEQSLAARHVPEEAARAVLDRLSEIALVDDAQFARDWIASRQSRRSLSRNALRRELHSKGVDRETVDEALTEVASADEIGLARDLARRKSKGMVGLPADVRARRLAAALGRRGFSSDIVRRAVDELMTLNLD